jgi:hypothetical protein
MAASDMIVPTELVTEEKGQVTGLRALALEISYEFASAWRA